MSERPINRRKFFREGLVELVRKLQEAAKPLADAARQFGALEGELEAAASSSSSSSSSSSTSVPPPQQTWIRPPGAIAEEQFVNQCTRSGECVRACPAQCIQIDYSGTNGGGSPYIDPEAMACTVCDGLVCMSACPSGALVRVERSSIRMGTATWHHESCLRSVGQECTTCIDRCPIGPAAIQITEGKVHVSETGCIGCGVCQHDCPTYPRSITVTPRTSAPPYAAPA